MKTGGNFLLTLARITAFEILGFLVPLEQAFTCVCLPYKKVRSLTAEICLARLHFPHIFLDV